jgi:hypothetical protein
MGRGVSRVGRPRWTWRLRARACRGTLAGIRTHQAPGIIHSFRDLMMPALVRVGAVTEPTRVRFAEAGIHVYDDRTSSSRSKTEKPVR